MIISPLPEKDEKINTPKRQVKIGKGFSSIAGMQELKDTLKLDVIDAPNDKERYKEYGLSIPNGILLLKREIPPIYFRGFPNTGEMITLEHRYIYLPEDVELEEEQLAIELEEAFV